MNIRIITGAFAALALSGGTYAADAAPPPTPTEQAAAPSPGSVWMGGQWEQESGKWRWVAAHWEVPPSQGATWVAGHWAPENGTWAWVNGAWNVGGDAAYATPPAPPGAAGMPTPSSPPPLINGEQQLYAPGTATVTTEYAPVGYYDPAYAYWGDPWLWWGGGFVGYYGWGGYRGWGGYHGGHGGYGGFHGGAVRGGGGRR